MRRKIRRLVHSGWTLVTIKCTYRPYDYWTSGAEIEDDNIKDYESMLRWCMVTLKQGEYDMSLHSYSGTNEPGTKRFVFKHERDALLFRLRWE